MWRRICTLLFLASLAAAQSKGYFADRSSLNTAVISGPATVATIYQRYNVLRRGHEQEIEVLLCQPSTSFLGGPYCPAGPLDLNPLHQEKLAPLALEFNSLPEFTVRFRKGDEYRALSRGTPLSIGRRKTFLLKLRAGNDVALGLHVLEGRARFLQGDQGPGGVWAGNGDVQEIAVKVPVMIVERDAKAFEMENWPGRRNTDCKPARLPDEVFSMIQALTLQWLMNHAGI